MVLNFHLWFGYFTPSLKKQTICRYLRNLLSMRKIDPSFNRIDKLLIQQIAIKFETLLQDFYLPLQKQILQEDNSHDCDLYKVFPATLDFSYFAVEKLVKGLDNVASTVQLHFDAFELADFPFIWNKIRSLEIFEETSPFEDAETIQLPRLEYLETDEVYFFNMPSLRHLKTSYFPAYLENISRYPNLCKISTHFLWSSQVPLFEKIPFLQELDFGVDFSNKEINLKTLNNLEKLIIRYSSGNELENFVPVTGIPSTLRSLHLKVSVARRWEEEIYVFLCVKELKNVHLHFKCRKCSATLLDADNLKKLKVNASSKYGNSENTAVIARKTKPSLEDLKVRIKGFVQIVSEYPISSEEFEQDSSNNLVLQATAFPSDMIRDVIFYTSLHALEIKSNIDIRSNLDGYRSGDIIDFFTLGFDKIKDVEPIASSVQKLSIVNTSSKTHLIDTLIYWLSLFPELRELYVFSAGDEEKTFETILQMKKSLKQLVPNFHWNYTKILHSVQGKDRER